MPEPSTSTEAMDSGRTSAMYPIHSKFGDVFSPNKRHFTQSPRVLGNASRGVLALNRRHSILCQADTTVTHILRRCATPSPRSTGSL